MPGPTRKEQNRIAQRNFRKRKMEKARKTEEELESLQVMYKTLLQEYEALKGLQTGPERDPRQASEGVPDYVRCKRRSQSIESLQSVQSLPSEPSVMSVQPEQSLHSQQLGQWLQSVQSVQSLQSAQSVRSVQSVQSVQSHQQNQSPQAKRLEQLEHSARQEQTVELFDFAKEFENSCVSVVANDSLPPTPVEHSYQCEDGFAMVPNAADSGISDLNWHAVSAPPNQPAYAAAVSEPAATEFLPFSVPPADGQTSLCGQNASTCAAMPQWSDLPDLPEIVTWSGQQGYEPCQSLSAPPPLVPLAPSYDPGLANGFAGPSSRLDMVHAVLQAGAMQERLAYFELEVAKMRASQCAFSPLQVG